MNLKWLNLVLLITNRIYEKKQLVIKGADFKVIGNVLSLIFFELLLAIVSLPLYFGTKTSGVVAFFQEKGGYEKISTDYKLRRVLTMSSVGVMLIIWLIKFLFIVFTPVVYGPMELYSVTSLSPVAVNDYELIAKDTGMQTAKVVSGFVIPKITKVERLKGDKYEISGEGKPGETISLFLVDQRTLLYSDVVGADGLWKLEHMQSDFRLKEGVHPIFVCHYDKDLGIRSEFSSQNFFRIKTSFLEKVSNNIDVIANWSVAGLIALGIFLTFLTI